MEPNQIKNAPFLDILFEGRNKEYGAYELRKTYNRRMVKSMVVMGSVVGLLLLGGVVSGKAKRVVDIGIVDTVNLARAIDPPPPPPPPPPRVVQPQVATRIFTTLRIVPDEDVKKDEKPPENDSLDNVRIGTVNKDGVADGNLVGPPSDGVTNNVVTAPKKSDDDGRFIPIEIEAEFPGGLEAWRRFLNKNLHVPDAAVDQGVSGTVVVQFIVDLDGNVSDVKAISGPETGGLREEAERVIRKSGKWVPAVQNGRHVKAYRRQPVVFQIDEN